MNRRWTEPASLAVFTAAALWISYVDPSDRLTWWLEALPVILGLPLLMLTRQRFPLTPLAYRLLFVHAIILLIGAHYTYAQVPAGDWVRGWLGLSRNPYDRLGHLAQGFVPAIVAREVLLRRTPLDTGPWLFFLVTCFCLAFSAFYELIEWWVAVLGRFAADAFLVTQGDVWDTQWDMFLALLGSIAAQLYLAGRHDRQLAQLGSSVGPSAAP